MVKIFISGFVPSASSQPLGQATKNAPPAEKSWSVRGRSGRTEKNFFIGVHSLSLRPDPNFDMLVSKIFPDREEYEEQQEKVSQH